MHCIVYNELGESEPVRITAQEAIDWAKSAHDYSDDAEALQDFITVHWAWIEEE